MMSWIWLKHARACRPNGHFSVLVLFVLSDMADDAGICFPSIPYLSETTQISERKLQSVISDLEKDGFLKRTIGGTSRGIKTTYQLLDNPARCAPIPTDNPAQRAPINGSNPAQRAPITQQVTPHAASVTPHAASNNPAHGVGPLIDLSFKSEASSGSVKNTHTPSPPNNPAQRAPITGVAEQPVADPPPSSVRVMPPPNWKLTEEQRNLVDMLLVGSPPGLVAELSTGTITPVHRSQVIQAVKREAQERHVSHGEALEIVMELTRNQTANIPFERLKFCGEFEKYFNKSTYRKDPIHFQERSNGTSKGAGTIAAARAVLAKDRAKDFARLGGNNGTAAGMLALIGRVGASQG